MLAGNYTDTFLNSSTPDVLGFCTAIPIELLGAPLFYLWCVLLTTFMVGAKTRTSGAAGMALFFISCAFIASLPENTYGAILIFGALAFTACLYRVFTKERS